MRLRAAPPTCASIPSGRDTARGGESALQTHQGTLVFRMKAEILSVRSQLLRTMSSIKRAWSVLGE